MTRGLRDLLCRNFYRNTKSCQIKKQISSSGMGRKKAEMSIYLFMMLVILNDNYILLVKSKVSKYPVLHSFRYFLFPGNLANL